MSSQPLERSSQLTAIAYARVSRATWYSASISSLAPSVTVAVGWTGEAGRDSGRLPLRSWGMPTKPARDPLPELPGGLETRVKSLLEDARTRVGSAPPRRSD